MKRNTQINLNQTLEQIERIVWEEPKKASFLVITCHQLRRKLLKEFTIEDLRIMIGQNFNLEILIPMAIEKFRENILAEGNFYEGDLLMNVLNSESSYWINHKDHWKVVRELYELNKDVFNSENDYKQIRETFKKFSAINYFFQSL
jgi:hypothetical protein